MLGELILIESQWNLNADFTLSPSFSNAILIESQWNLNFFMQLVLYICAENINRITVEFKLPLPPPTLLNLD